MKEEDKQSGSKYLLNRYGHGGLGIIHIDVLESGEIQITSTPLVVDHGRDLSPISDRRNYLMIIKQDSKGDDVIEQEKSIVNRTHKARQKRSYRPKITEIEDVLINGEDERDSLLSAGEREKILKRISDVFTPKKTK